MGIHYWFTVSCIFLLAVQYSSATILTSNVDASNCSFEVSVEGQLWLAGGVGRVFEGGSWHVPEFAGSFSTSGRDQLGAFTATSCNWTAGSRLQTTVKRYQQEHAVVFELLWPDGAQGTNMSTPNAGGASS